MPVCLEPVGQGDVIVLDKPVIFVGRESGCDVVLTGSHKISRKHCCFAQVDNNLIVRDLGSRNGVRVNGKLICPQAVLSLGDEIIIGDIQFRLTRQNGTPKPKPP